MKNVKKILMLAVEFIYMDLKLFQKTEQIVNLQQ